MSTPSPGSTGPNEVRAYITQILISKHDAAQDVAQKIANQWQFGRPNDLCQAGVKSFNQAFGTEVRTFLFRTMQEDIEAEWRGSTAGLVNYWTTVLSIILSIFFVIRAFNRGSNRGMLASIRHASLAFGPPMLLCGFQDEYSSFRFMRVLWGGMVSCLAFFLYLFEFLERSSETGEDGRVPKKID